ncbi:MAG: GLPGLI family protein [Bacteroidales bacterium]|jgi:GLPGLI family protein|nr:GLPGLI family protein [Bacteroidales bacterium]
MRKLFFLFAFLFSFPIFAQLRFNYPLKVIESAELLVTYSLKFQQDTLNPEFIQQEDMLLFLGQNISKCISQELYVFDTIMRKIKSPSEFQGLISDHINPLPMSRFRPSIFKNYPKDKLTCIHHIIDGTFWYEEDIDLFNWQLTADTSTLYGYKVQKATTEFGGRSWTAWFAPNLPFNDGPYKFNGLPGLIVKIFDSRNHYVFEFISIKKPYKELMIDYVEKDFIKSTKEDFFRAKDSFREDIINRAKAAGLNNEMQQRAARNMARLNNPIELKRK